MRPSILASILGLGPLGLLACNTNGNADKSATPLAIPADAEGQPALVEHNDRAKEAAAWREELTNARMRFETLKADVTAGGTPGGEATDRLVQKTSDALDAANATLTTADQVAADEFDGFKAMMDRHLDGIEADLKDLDESVTARKTSTASREIEEDHE